VTLQHLPLAKLVEDFEVYPRHTTDEVWVNQLAELLRSEKQFDWQHGWQGGPVIVDERTLRIVDGWQRCRAARKVYGDTASIWVDVLQYASELDLFQAAADANTRHGRKLDHMDRVRIAVKLRELGATTAKVAVTLRMREREVVKLTLQTAEVPAGTPGGITIRKLSNGSTSVGPAPTVRTVLPTKRGARHLAGGVMTPNQAAGHSSLPGNDLGQVAWQLLKAIRGDLIDKANPKLMATLRDLRDELNTLLGP
jgi:hypothetical protein